jgi:hypothetical protein
MSAPKKKSKRATKAKKVSVEKAVESKSDEVVVSYKGFSSELKCRDFQFAVGASYETQEVAICAAGFHACSNPLDVLNYYSLLDDNAKPNRFCVVEQSGKLARHSEDSKIASAKITITAELDLGEFIKRVVRWVTDACKGTETAASGDHARLAASGDHAKLAASGYYAQLAASGYYAKLAASGYHAQLAASGDHAQLAASGHYAQLAASGDHAKLAASGYYAQLAASGDHAQLAASGDSAKLAASGDHAQLAASGDSAKLAASGHYAQLAASGDHAQLAASGDSAKLAANGKDSVIASSSYNARAKGPVGTWISLAEFDAQGKCVGFATGCVGSGGIPADTWLLAKGGKLEAQS